MEEETKTEETQEEEVKEEAAAEETDAAPEASEESEEEKPLEKMTAPELKEVAGKIPGVTGVTAMKKADLIALIKEHRGIADEEPQKEDSTRVADLKKKIVDLKAAKADAREKKNKKEVDILRRRINRLKKMTRKAG